MSNQWGFFLLLRMRLTRQNRGISNLSHVRSTASNMGNHVVIFVQPAVTGNLKQVGTLAWIWDQDAAQEISCMWSDVFRKRQGSGGDVLVEEVDVVAFRICWVIIEG